MGLHTWQESRQRVCSLKAVACDFRGIGLDTLISPKALFVGLNALLRGAMIQLHRLPPAKPELVYFVLFPLQGRARRSNMVDLLIALAFLGMVIAPVIVAAKNGADVDEAD